MNDDELKKLFADASGQTDASAKARARAAAMAAFDAAQGEQNAQSEEPSTREINSTATQGTAEIHRLTPDNDSSRRKKMTTTLFSKDNQRWVYSGLASAAVLLIAVTVVIQAPQHGGYEVADGNSSHSIVPELSEPSGAERKQVLQELAVNARRSEEAASREMSMDAAAPPAPMSAARNKAETGFFAATPAADADVMPPSHYQDVGRDQFATVDANPINLVSESPVSTFSIDVDTASYSFVRRQLNQGVLPQKAAVRLEEMVNYFPYDYPLPADRSTPFSTHVTVLDSPWKAGNKLVHIGIKGYEMPVAAAPKSNLVFLLDVSGSMNNPDKLPLVKQSMGLLLSKLQPEDTVAIVVYAGAAGTVLEPTPVKDKQKILGALNRLNAGGSTAGAAGIELAYQLAEAHFVKDGVNRILLATDGDFNVGINDREELKGFVERKRDSGIYLSVLGFGQGNYHDQLMQTLAQNGNGVAAYIDTLGEAQKVLVDEATSTLFPIAGDVKIQVEFNPATVSEYRLLGYETRMLAREDFNNDAVDAGDIGAGHTVTAIYEITPAGSDSGVFEASRYDESQPVKGKGSEYGFIKLRYKLPGEQASKLISTPVAMSAKADSKAQQESQFASAVAGFAQLLQGGKYTGEWSYSDALKLAQANKGEDRYGYRAEFTQLIRKAEVADGL